MEFKSKIKKYVSFKNVDLSEYAKHLDVSKDIINNQVTKFLTQYASIKEVDYIQKRDLVELACVSQLPRYNKEHMRLRVGLNLMGKDFEQQLIGLNKNETVTLTINNEDVKVTILNIQRDVLPELNDTFVESCHIEDVSTVYELENKCLSLIYTDELEEEVDEAQSYLGGVIMDQCEFELDQDEVNISYNAYKESFKDKEELSKEFITSITISSLKAALLGEYCLRERNQLITHEDYLSHIQKMAVAKNCSEEKAMEEESEISYLIDQYADYYMTRLENYTLTKLIELGRDK